MNEGVAKLEAVLERQAQMERSLDNPHRRNAMADKADALARALVADPGSRAAIVQRAEAHPDPLVRESLHLFVNPPPPQEHGPSFDRWLEHPAVGLGHLVGTLRTHLCPVLPEGPAGVDDDLGSSWLAGLPSTGGGPWPRDSLGRPLALVMQASLDLWGYGGATEDLVAGAELPTTGVLQIFHDLWTEDPSSLCVRHVAEPGDEVDDQPEDYDLPALPARATMQEFGPSLRSPLDVKDISAEEAGQWGEVRQRLLDWLTWSVRGEYGTPARPVATLLGYSWDGEDEALLRLGLSPAERDDWVLLADIPGVRHLEGWFGDEGHLEVWVRRTDLRAGRLDRARPLLRQG